MIIVVYNKSRKKRLIKSKRILSSLLMPLYDRVHIGNIPSRTIIDLIKKLKETSGRGTDIKVFFESKSGYNGFKMIQIGKEELYFMPSQKSNSNIDSKLIKEKIIPNFKIKK